MKSLAKIVHHDSGFSRSFLVPHRWTGDYQIAADIEEYLQNFGARLGTRVAPVKDTGSTQKEIMGAFVIVLPDHQIVQRGFDI